MHLLVNSERQRETVDSTAAESVSIHGDENGKKQEKRQMPVFCKEIAGGVVIFGEWCYDDCTIYKRNEINS